MQLLRQFIISFLELFSILLLVRAIFSWLPSARNSKIYEIIHLLTEPVIRPFRVLFDRIEIFRNFPLDLSFFAALIAIQLLSTLFIYI